MSLIISCIIDK